MAGIIGKKIGMTRVFDEAGKSIPVTVIEAGPCFITQIKSEKTDGYSAVQLGYDEKKDKNTNKPETGHFAKAGVKPLRILREFKNFEDTEKLSLGGEINVGTFVEGEGVIISGVTKGKGFQGVVKRYGFAGGPKSHGQSDRLRAPGSLGQSSYPSRVFKGIKMGGRMGGDKVTFKKRRVIKVIPEKNLILIEGSVPGSVSSIVTIKR